MITKEHLTKHLHSILEEIVKMSQSGQAEYVHNENAFDNFERLSYELNTTREKILWVYLKKHLDGILNYIKKGSQQREPIHGRVLDAIVYLIILDAMIKDSSNPIETAKEDVYR